MNKQIAIENPVSCRWDDALFRRNEKLALERCLQKALTCQQLVALYWSAYLHRFDMLAAKIVFEAIQIAECFDEIAAILRVKATWQNLSFYSSSAESLEQELLGRMESLAVTPDQRRFYYRQIHDKPTVCLQ
jgi:hypothetical protein